MAPSDGLQSWFRSYETEMTSPYPPEAAIERLRHSTGRWWMLFSRRAVESKLIQGAVVLTEVTRRTRGTDAEGASSFSLPMRVEFYESPEGSRLFCTSHMSSLTRLLFLGGFAVSIGLALMFINSVYRQLLAGSTQWATVSLAAFGGAMVVFGSWSLLRGFKDGPDDHQYLVDFVRRVLDAVVVGGDAV